MDTEETGKELLQRGKLKKRYTIIPLNKIAAKGISGDVIKRAQSLVCTYVVALSYIPAYVHNTAIAKILWDLFVKLQVGKSKARPALSLVGYDEELRPALEFVFGSTFVCDSLDIAKKVCTLVSSFWYDTRTWRFTPD